MPRTGTTAARPDVEESRRLGDSEADASSDAGDEEHGDGESRAPKGCFSALTSPVQVGELGSYGHAGEAAFWIWPLFGPLLFDNTSSDVRIQEKLAELVDVYRDTDRVRQVRDGLANERTFLSYLRLAVTMAVVAVAIVLSFHLKNQPSPLELRMAQPLGILFWLLSVLTLFVGVANYISRLETVNSHSRRLAIVQSGWKTQSVMGGVALAILGSCVTLLVINKIIEKQRRA